MENKRVHLIVRGKVQGVFFRASTVKKAQEMGLKGFVSNREDGSVQITAEGHKDKLLKLIDWSYKGPERAQVSSVEADWTAYRDEYKDFTINY